MRPAVGSGEWNRGVEYLAHEWGECLDILSPRCGRRVATLRNVVIPTPTDSGEVALYGSICALVNRTSAQGDHHSGVDEQGYQYQRSYNHHSTRIHYTPTLG